MNFSKASLSLIFIFTTFIPYSSSQVQIGQDLLGDGFTDHFGRAVSISQNGNRMAASAPKKLADKGQVKVFENINNVWTQIGMDIIGENSGDDSGDALSLSSDGTRVAIGARSNTANGELSGHVRVYQWANNAWTQLGQDIDGDSIKDVFGSAVSLSGNGNRLAVGAFGNDVNGSFSGQVKVFEWINNTWMQMGQDFYGDNTGDGMGVYVSLSQDGSRLAMGAGGYDVNAEDAGQVKVFEWKNNSWEQVGVDILGNVEAENSGFALSMSGDGNRLAVGAPHFGPARYGRVSIYEWQNGAWLLLGSPIVGDETGDLAGTSVSLSFDGNRVAFGAPNNDDAAFLSGKVKVFEWKGGSWIQIGSDIRGEAVRDFCGQALALSGNGASLAVGSYLNDDSNENAGKVRVFDFSVSVDIQDIKEKNIQIYPNPVQDHLIIHADDINSGSTVYIINTFGQLAQKESVFHQGPAFLNVQELSTGLYTLIIEYEGTLFSSRFIKQ